MTDHLSVKQNVEKRTFFQKLGLQNFFGKIVKTEWVTGIEIEEQREAEIILFQQQCRISFYNRA